MSKAYKECKREILNMLIIEKKLKKQLEEIQKVKLQAIYILMGGEVNVENLTEWNCKKNRNK